MWLIRYVITMGEDLTIGFQCRIERFPDVYESEFWYYFTNNYVNKQNIRHSSYCGACTLIDQNKLWYSKKAWLKNQTPNLSNPIYLIPQFTHNFWSNYKTKVT